MKIKWKASVLAILGSYSFSTQALERVYQFNADFISSNWNLTLTRDGAEPFIDLRNFTSNQTPSSRFVTANPDISGHFAYNTNAPIIHSTNNPTVTSTTYNSNSSLFSTTLNSESGNTGQFSLTEDSVYHETSIYSNFIQNRQTFNTRGGGITPDIALTGSTNDDFYFVDISAIDNTGFFNETLSERFPDVFGEISTFGLEIHSINTPELKLNANSMRLNLAFNGLNKLPIDSSLPNNLPQLADSISSSFTLGFNSDSYKAQPDIHVSYIEFAENVETLIPGDIGYQDKFLQIEEFLSYASISSNITIDYSLTELSLVADGLTANTPLLPNIEPSLEEGFEFTFETSNDGEFTFIDPDVAIGYDYEVTSGSTFVSVLLPEDIGDNQYDLWLFDSELGEFIDSDIDLTGGIAYTFDQEGLSLFRILGIEIDELIDPNDPFSFVTGLKFADLGTTVNISQTAISQFVPTTVPVPPALILFASGMIGLFVQRRTS